MELRANGIATTSSALVGVHMRAPEAGDLLGEAALKRLDRVRGAQVSAKDRRVCASDDPALVTPERIVETENDAAYEASVEA